MADNCVRQHTLQRFEFLYSADERNIRGHCRLLLLCQRTPYPLQVRENLGNGLVAEFAGPDQKATDQNYEALREVLRLNSQIRKFSSIAIFASAGMRTREEFRKENAQGEDVGALIKRFPLLLFR